MIHSALLPRRGQAALKMCHGGKAVGFDESQFCSLEKGTGLRAGAPLASRDKVVRRVVVRRASRERYANSLGPTSASERSRLPLINEIAPSPQSRSSTIPSAQGRSDPLPVMGHRLAISSSGSVAHSRETPNSQLVQVTVTSLAGTLSSQASRPSTRWKATFTSVLLLLSLFALTSPCKPELTDTTAFEVEICIRGVGLFPAFAICNARRRAGLTTLRRYTAGLDSFLSVFSRVCSLDEAHPRSRSSFALGCRTKAKLFHLESRL